MNNQLRSIAKSRLALLVRRVLADGKIDETDREALNSIFRQAVLTVGDVKDVFGQYLKGVEREVLADGVVTDEERERCRTVVTELRIPLRLLSPGLRAIVRGEVM